MIERELLEALALKRGHFRYESGHHGDLWLDLDALFADSPRVCRWATALAEQARPTAPEWICGPVVGGASLAREMAATLDTGYAWADRTVTSQGEARYRIPDALRPWLADKRVLLVDDAINAGWASRATLTELDACGAEVVGLACLLALGDTAAELAKARAVPLLAAAGLARSLWKAEACPLCQAGVPIDLPAREKEEK